MDIWSVGVILFALLNGETPFESLHTDEFDLKHKKGDYTFKPSCHDRLTVEALLFINQCLQSEETQRADSTALYNHPYITTPYED